MNKKLKTIIIGLVVIVVLALAILVLTLMDKNDASSGESEESSVVSVEDTSAILWYHSDGIQSLKIHNSKGEYMIERTSSGSYEIKELDGFEQYDEGYETVSDIYSLFRAYMTVEENADDFSKYGLDDPTATIEVAFPNGEEHTILIGNLIIGAEGYYCRVDGTGAVYGVDLSYLYGMTLTAYDFVDPEVIPVWTAPEVEEDETQPVEATISYFEVTGGLFGDETLVVEKCDEVSLAVTYTGLATQYEITSPVEASYRVYMDSSLETQAVSYRMLHGFEQLTAYSVAMIAPTDEQKAEYGFDQPYASVRFNRDGEDYEWIIGAEVKTSGGANARYLMSADKEVVYIVLKEDLPWIQAEMMDVVSTIVLYPNVTEVASVEVEYNGKSHLLTHDINSENKVEKGYVDGQEIKEVSYYRNLYQYIMSVAVVDVNDEHLSSDDLAARITYHYMDGRDDVIELFNIGDRRCILSFNGNNSFITKSSYVSVLESNISKVLNGEKPTLDW